MVYIVRDFSEFIFFHKFFFKALRNSYITVLSSPFHYKVFKKNLYKTSFFLLINPNLFLKKKVRLDQHDLSVILSKFSIKYVL